MECEPLLKLYSSHRVDLEMLEEIEDHIGLERDAPRSEALVDGLNSDGDLAKDTELVPVGKLGVL